MHTSKKKQTMKSLFFLLKQIQGLFILYHSILIFIPIK